MERFNDPLSAAKHIVRESFRTWLQFEVRTDDITIIVIFIEDFQGAVDAAVRLTLPNDGIFPFCCRELRRVYSFQLSRLVKRKIYRAIRWGGERIDALSCWFLISPPHQDSRERETKRRQSAAFIGESARPVRRYFSKEAKNRLVREGRALERDQGDCSRV